MDADGDYNKMAKGIHDAQSVLWAKKLRRVSCHGIGSKGLDDALLNHANKLI